jgi:hypothetical protein
VAEVPIIAVFHSNDNRSISYVLGDSMNLQDAYNATINNHFAPTQITMQEPILIKNDNDIDRESGVDIVETAEKEVKVPIAKIGKHSITDIMNKYQIGEEQLHPILFEGIEHEMEHSEHIIVAMAIAQDHLFERLDYYKRLKDMEKTKSEMTQIMAKGGALPRLPKANKLFHLPIEMAVYVPSTSDVSKAINQKEMQGRVEEVRKTLSEMFGGFTSAEFVGGYVSQEGALINEKIMRVVSYSTRDDFQKNKRKLMQQIANWAKMWGQEAIGFEYEGDLFYVDANYQTGGTIK